MLELGGLCVMLMVTVVLTSKEWLELRAAATHEWPGEALSRGEVMRRYALFGLEFRHHIPPSEVRRRAAQLQATQIVPDEHRMRD